jgi:hypothetical protein
LLSFEKGKRFEMPRFPQNEANKGSQKWIQKLVNQKPQILNSEIWNSLNFQEEEQVDWLSPRKKDHYAEYRDQAFLDLLGAKLEKLPLEQFWPKRGPQWDALGRSVSGKLFLVEAKSHIPELISSLHAENEESKRKIHESLEATKRHFGCNTNVDWSQYFYQYANRLAHLYLLRKNGFQAYLVNVYFLNDLEMNGPMSIDEWKGAKKLLIAYLGIGRDATRELVADVHIDVRALNLLV